MRSGGPRLPLARLSISETGRKHRLHPPIPRGDGRFGLWLNVGLSVFYERPEEQLQLKANVACKPHSRAALPVPEICTNLARQTGNACRWTLCHWVRDLAPNCAA